MNSSCIRRTVVVVALVLPWSGYSCSDTRAQGPIPANRPAEYAVVVERNVMIPMRDGVRLAADLYRPARDGKALSGRFPAVLTRTPYDKTTSKTEGEYYAGRGYVVVANDVRGRYASE